MPDVAPTLNDTQVLEFCKQGCLMLEGVVPDSINRRVSEYLAAHPYPNDDGGAFEDDGLLQQPWFVEDGEIREGPANVEEWPYRSPLEAIRDGWRVIQFPNMALMLDESHTYGLGCEFILERWG